MGYVDYALIDFKLAGSKIDTGAKNLIIISYLIDRRIHDKNMKIRKPKFLVVIVGGEYAYTHKDGLKFLPIGCLR